MSKCPVTTLRSWLEPLTDKIARLPIARGFPIPWFVARLKDGTAEFRAADSLKMEKALSQRRCWVCGDTLGYEMTFVIGPMCAINRVSSEPPSHYECARWSARNCPFLNGRQMERREDDFTDRFSAPGGIGIKRNPGVTLLWVTASFRRFEDGNGGKLIRIGDPIRTEWYAKGRLATRAEVEESTRTGLPALEEPARRDGRAAVAQLAKQTEEAKRFWPVA